MFLCKWDFLEEKFKAISHIDTGQASGGMVKFSFKSVKSKIYGKNCFRNPLGGVNRRSSGDMKISLQGCG